MCDGVFRQYLLWQTISGAINGEVEFLGYLFDEIFPCQFLLIIWETKKFFLKSLPISNALQINFFPPYKLIINRHLCLYLCRYVVVLNKLRSDQKLNPLMGNRIGNWLTLVRSASLFLVTICTTTVSVRERRYCRSTNYCPSLHDVHRNGLLGDHWWYWQRADLDITLGW